MKMKLPCMPKATIGFCPKPKDPVSTTGLMDAEPWTTRKRNVRIIYIKPKGWLFRDKAPVNYWDVDLCGLLSYCIHITKFEWMDEMGKEKERPWPLWTMKRCVEIMRRVTVWRKKSFITHSCLFSVTVTKFFVLGMINFEEKKAFIFAIYWLFFLKPILQDCNVFGSHSRRYSETATLCILYV